MSVPKKRAVVSKKLSDEQIKNSERWNAFVTASATPYELLTDSWYAVFEVEQI